MPEDGRKFWQVQGFIHEIPRVERESEKKFYYCKKKQFLCCEII